MQCTYDHTVDASALRLKKIRAYNVLKSSADPCVFWTSWNSYLIIDNLTHNDSGEYICSAWSNDALGGKAKSLTSQTLDLQVGKRHQAHVLRHKLCNTASVEQVPEIIKATTSTVQMMCECYTRFKYTHQSDNSLKSI